MTWSGGLFQASCEDCTLCSGWYDRTVQGHHVRDVGYGSTKGVSGICEGEYDRQDYDGMEEFSL